MKKYIAILNVLLLGIFLAVGARAQSNAAVFNGFWVLDREKTNTSKDFPIQLKDYKMLVSQDQDRLMVKAQVVGPVEVRVQPGSAGGGMSTTGSRTTTSNPNGIMATSGAGSSGGPASAANYGGTMALYFTAPDTTYDLTGKEIKIEAAAGNGPTRIKAKTGKDGKTMELTVIRQMRGPRGEVEVTTRETWRISDDGQSLKFHRSVETPAARDEINMIMAKSTQ